MVSFLDVTGIKPCPDLSPNQNALRIASGTEPTLIRKEDMTPLISYPVFVLSAPLCLLRAATANLSNSCTCGLERFLSVRNDTFVDSELCSYTGDGTPLLQLSDHSSTCEVVQGYSAPFFSFVLKHIVNLDRAFHHFSPMCRNSSETPPPPSLMGPGLRTHEYSLKNN
ncbi:hypothetical protein TNCV_2257661 [Trichonephila clavipes]|nr:hypothetical protein TNCV_2257661 [Trichonephila clavipes]